MLVNCLKVSSILLAALLAGQATAKTDLGGCVSSATVKYGGASLIWYVPDTGEICDFLDCGGGRAPPKTTVPGCAAYSGTATYSPSFLSGFGAAATVSSTENSIPSSTPASVPGTASASSSLATITTPPATTTLGTSTSAGSNSGSSSSTGSSSGVGPSSVSQGAAAMPTVVVKGAMGVVVGLVAGVAMI